MGFRWGWLAVAGLLVQVVLFSPWLADLDPGVGSVIYVASTGAVLVAVLRNWRIPGLVLVAVGAGANLVAIVTNGGVMPTTVAALETAGLTTDDAFSNSAVVADPAVPFLTDIFALPAWVPLANVFSLGDVLIGLGVAVTIALGMRGERARPAVESVTAATVDSPVETGAVRSDHRTGPSGRCVGALTPRRPTARYRWPMARWPFGPRLVWGEQAAPDRPKGT